MAMRNETAKAVSEDRVALERKARIPNLEAWTARIQDMEEREKIDSGSGSRI